ncbi:MAG TPA: DNA internalization-related competence protein ComEC/Rec2 [Abditibacterium sp.]|jgi:competence protein ComEC
MSPALSRAFEPLRFRPLLWMALAALSGIAAGGYWAGFVLPHSRADSRLLWPLVPALFAIVGICGFRFENPKRAFCAASLLFFVFAAYAARRITPPPGDISHLVQMRRTPIGPIQPLSINVRGVVADYPRRGDFATQFPLQCAAPQTGRIWVNAPYGTPVEIGDVVSLRLELQTLPMPGNGGERASFWRYIVASCWCIGQNPSDLQVLGVADAFGAARRIAVWRQKLVSHYESQFRGAGDAQSLQMRPFPAANAQLLTAMVFGEGGLSRPLPQTLRDDFRAAGLSHLLVASGTQVGFITALVLWMARGMGFRRAPLLILVVPVLVFYALLAGGAASIWRATLSGILLAWTLCLGRDIDGLSLWSAALLMLLCVDPANAWSLSFQLTFGATWGLLVVAPALVRIFRARFGRVAAFDLAAFSLGAQSATLPISMFHFGTFSAAGLGANFVAVPLAGLMVLTGLLGLILAPFNWLNYFLTRAIASLAHGFALLPGAQLESAPLALSWSAGCYVLLLMAITPISLDWKAIVAETRQKWGAKWRFHVSQLRPWPFVILFLLAGSWLWWWQNGPRNPELRVTMFDVGQGESILVQTPAGQNILIDGGSLDGRQRSDIGAQVLVPALQSLGVERLDLMVLTHADADHCNGLRAVVNEIPVGAFLDGAATLQQRPDPSQLDYYELRKTLSARKIPVLKPFAGQIFKFGEAKFTLLAPTLPAFEAENDNSIVARLDFGQNSFLLTGDIEEQAEARLVARGANLKCTVLKVAHHGSKTSSTPVFLKATNPRVALVSCGRYNRFGHPNPRTVRNLDTNETSIFRTDVSGALTVSCDKAACRVNTFR